MAFFTRKKEPKQFNSEEFTQTVVTVPYNAQDHYKSGSINASLIGAELANLRPPADDPKPEPLRRRSEAMKKGE